MPVVNGKGVRMRKGGDGPCCISLCLGNGFLFEVINQRSLLCLPIGLCGIKNAEPPLM